MSKSTGKPKERQPKAKIIKRRRAPGMTVQARENQIISLAYDLAEKRIRNGSATSQEVVHFLKMGSSKEMLEKAKLDHENKLLQARTEALESQKKIEELYSKAIRSMAVYQGREPTNDEDD